MKASNRQWPSNPRQSMKRTQTTLKRTMKKVLWVVIRGPVLLFSALVLIGLAAGVALTAREL